MNILTREAIDHLLRVYAEESPDAARALAPGYGIKPEYVKKLACNHGVRSRRRGRKPRQYKRYPDAIDPRWQRAIERGAVRI